MATTDMRERPANVLRLYGDTSCLAKGEACKSLWNVEMLTMQVQSKLA